jgi:hypothetical protein
MLRDNFTVPYNAPAVPEAQQAGPSEVQRDPGEDSQPPDENSQEQQPDVGMDTDGDPDADPDVSMGLIGSLEPEAEDFAAQVLLEQLGAVGRKYRRELNQQYKALVSEVYSPPRVTKEIKMGGFKHVLPGFSFDITVNDPMDNQPLDFCLKSKRERARRLLREQRVTDVQALLHLASAERGEEQRSRQDATCQGTGQIAPILRGTALSRPTRCRKVCAARASRMGDFVARGCHQAFDRPRGHAPGSSRPVPVRRRSGAWYAQGQTSEEAVGLHDELGASGRAAHATVSRPRGSRFETTGRIA